MSPRRSPALKIAVGEPASATIVEHHEQDQGALQALMEEYGQVKADLASNGLAQQQG